MPFKDIALADLDGILNTDQLGDAGTYFASGVATGFACTLTIGDGEANVAPADASLRQDRLVQAVGAAAVIKAGILAVSGRARNPAQGDSFQTSDGRTFGVHAAWLDGLGAQLFTLADRSALTGTRARDSA